MEEPPSTALETLPRISLSPLSGGAAERRGPVCGGCRGVIAERFLLRLNDGGVWHERCVRCAWCWQPLESPCFHRDQKLYCRLDYEKSLV
ncbi:LIM homeobox transcription factor 1-alpha [Sceloporus undulatus]|uniref:LIM homeobox transcription factor 1-alpha n=1 Tax=Sceloporus undulatus TaxID=8520 RepID=UPI001C4D761E|nr:LIM homeobox transcription factor 1-alpha [Sceloporus undulatus]